MSTLLSVTLRMEPNLVEAVDQLAAGNYAACDGNRSEMIRLLIRRGIRAVVEDSGGTITLPTSELSRTQFGQRLTASLQDLSQLLTDREATDPAGAILAAQGVGRSALAWAESRLATQAAANPPSITLTAGIN